jgi:hypothetical protein
MQSAPENRRRPRSLHMRLEFREKMIKGVAANQAQTRKFDVGNRARPSPLF